MPGRVAGLLSTLAGMKTEEEFGEDGMSGDDAVSALSWAIMEARAAVAEALPVFGWVCGDLSKPGTYVIRTEQDRDDAIGRGLPVEPLYRGAPLAEPARSYTRDECLKLVSIGAVISIALAERMPELSDGQVAAAAIEGAHAAVEWRD